MKEEPSDSPDKQALQESLQAAQKKLQQLQRIKPLASAAAAIVHDVRNSLGVIQSTW